MQVLVTKVCLESFVADDLMKIQAMKCSDLLPLISILLRTYVLEEILLYFFNTVEWRNLLSLSASLKQKMHWKCDAHLKRVMILLSACKCYFWIIQSVVSTC